MTKIVKDIIDLDQQAQENLRLLQQEKEALTLTLNQKKRQMEEDYQKEIIKIRQERQKNHDEKNKQMEMAFQEKEIQMKATLKKQFDSHEKEWLEQMLNLITKRV